MFWRPELIRIKRTRPGDDLLSALIAARDSGNRLSEEELTNLACTILVVGYETTAHHIRLSLLALLDHPAEMARLRAEAMLDRDHPGSICPDEYADNYMNMRSGRTAVVIHIGISARR